MESFNVLLVDDEADFLDTLLKRLSKRKLHVIGANSGEAALEIIKQHQIDVVVLDVKMAGMDGIQTLREIKKLNPMIEVIMLTGHASLEVAIEGMQSGAFDYLMKPVDLDELLYKLQDGYEKKKIQEGKIKMAKKKLLEKKDAQLSDKSDS